jgi:hypothetical protein
MTNSCHTNFCWAAQAAHEKVASGATSGPIEENDGELKTRERFSGASSMRVLLFLMTPDVARLATLASASADAEARNLLRMT